MKTKKTTQYQKMKKEKVPALLKGKTKRLLIVSAVFALLAIILLLPLSESPKVSESNVIVKARVLSKEDVKDESGQIVDGTYLYNLEVTRVVKDTYSSTFNLTGSPILEKRIIISIPIIHYGWREHVGFVFVDRAPLEIGEVYKIALSCQLTVERDSSSYLYSPNYLDCNEDQITKGIFWEGQLKDWNEYVSGKSALILYLGYEQHDAYYVMYTFPLFFVLLFALYFFAFIKEHPVFGIFADLFVLIYGLPAIMAIDVKYWFMDFMILFPLAVIFFIWLSLKKTKEQIMEKELKKKGIKYLITQSNKRNQKRIERIRKWAGIGAVCGVCLNLIIGIYQLASGGLTNILDGYLMTVSLALLMEFAVSAVVGAIIALVTLGIFSIGIRTYKKVKKK